ncbi:Gfo/Idh/MocA family protein [Sphingosinicella sp. BN140058]|uniref:Gfo/Idh/MocA family protein n=1 Tax=Sphingosinicella sp. BN140058 TaxID=1892855 RepID=UPI00101082EB|nr:Gfo/Idh/MocA family oxidoreductase [Sphingosinicella sp. BN140058]QAY77153.1 Gfo/Idh/MocA family oxidoreductase [Sphingosinicella sp. BN140058]
MTLRVAILGPGGIAARHAAAVRALAPDLDLVGVCGRDPARAAAFAHTHGGAPFTDLDRMIGAVAPDLLIVALPPFAHRGEAEQAARRGVHLLVEKPLALDIATANRMVAAAQASGIVAANGFMYRFGDAVRRWKALDTGRPAVFAGAFHCNALHADWWREEAKSGGQLLEQIIHLIDLVRHCVGNPDSVYARRGNLFHRAVAGYDIEDVSAILFGWDDGRIATINASNASVPGVWHKSWSIIAERMTGRFTGWNDAEFTPATGGAASQTATGTTDPFVAQLADIAEAIRDRRAPAVPLAEGAATLRLALAARQAADEGRELRLT